MFPKLHTFLQAGQPRRLSVRQPDGKVDVRMYSAKDCRDFTLGQGRGRSASPTKRTRSDIDSVDDDASETKHCRPRSTSNSFDSAVADLENSPKTERWTKNNDSKSSSFTASTERTACGYWSLGEDQQDEDRGRKRRRSVGSQVSRKPSSGCSRVAWPCRQFIHPRSAYGHARVHTPHLLGCVWHMRMFEGMVQRSSVT